MLRPNAPSMRDAAASGSALNPKMQSFREIHGLQSGGIRSGQASPCPSTPASTSKRGQQGSLLETGPCNDIVDDGDSSADEGGDAREFGSPRHLPVDIWLSENGGGSRKKKSSGIAVAVRIRPLRLGTV